MKRMKEIGRRHSPFFRLSEYYLIPILELNSGNKDSCEKTRQCILTTSGP